MCRRLLRAGLNKLPHIRDVSLIRESRRYPRQCLGNRPEAGETPHVFQIRPGKAPSKLSGKILGELFYESLSVFRCLLSRLYQQLPFRCLEYLLMEKKVKYHSHGSVLFTLEPNASMEAFGYHSAEELRRLNERLGTHIRLLEERAERRRVR